MITIQINTSKPYPVKIGQGILGSVGAELAALGKSRTAAIVSDSTVFPLYGKAVTDSLEDAGFSVVSFVFPAGESSKNADVYLRLLAFLAENHITRTDWIVALGGGVVGDLAGFAAATYLRGIDFIQIPTTLLAAVDSSVGGKTAIDLPVGKNLVGAFHQPKLVLCDVNTLGSLPENIFRDGCAEVIKYGILYDPALLSLLADTALDFPREQVIAACVEWKRKAVCDDEFDSLGARALLNLGHTFGHGVEAKSNFTVSHGKGVAIGTAIMARACAAKGICSEETCSTVLSVLNRFGLPVSTDFDAEDICEAAFSDKKRSGNSIGLIVIRSVGDCSVQKTPLSEILPFLKAGM